MLITPVVGRGTTKTYSLHISVDLDLLSDIVHLGTIQWWGWERTRHLWVEMFFNSLRFVRLLEFKTRACIETE